MITDIEITKLENGKYELQFDWGTGDLNWKEFNTLDELLDFIRKMVESYYEL